MDSSADGWAREVRTVRVVGAGVMGRGIAQWAAAGGLTVQLADAVPGAVEQAVETVGAMFGRLADKGRMTAEDAAAARARLEPVDDPLAPLDGVDLVVEAVREDLAAKRELFTGLEKVAPADTVLATNTSSLSVTAIGATLDDPSRLAGLHFFNPVPLMRLVEVVPGARTADHLTGALTALVRRLGHTPVLAPDTPGFLVNHAGRGLATEALAILGEGTATAVDIDRLARDVLGLKMGPFELMDLTGLDVSHPVLEGVWEGFYGEPRLRPSPITRARADAGLLGRKVGEGFYTYTNGVKDEPEPPAPPAPDGRPIWIAPDVRDRLFALLGLVGVEIETGDAPSAEAVVLVAPDARSTVDVARELDLPVERTVGVDPFGGFGDRLTLLVHPGVDRDAARAAWAALAETGRDVTLVRDGVVSPAARLLASIVNVGCGIAELRLADPGDVDTAVRLGLGYPRGPLTWGEQVGAATVLGWLTAMYGRTGDPRYRASLWLRDRVEVGLPLTAVGTVPVDLLD